MKKDIPFDKVLDVAIAIVPMEDRTDNLWQVYLVNLKKENLEGVLVTSKGYGKQNGEQVKTSTMRHSLDVVEATSVKLIEAIDAELFSLSHEFWLSFWIDGKMYDKKYVFVTESIRDDNFTTVPLLGRKGVMIK